MLEEPLFVQNLGSIIITIWSFPKDRLPLLINVLKTNFSNVFKIRTPMRFKHKRNDFNHECNCKDKIEEISLEFARDVYKYEEIYIPLEIIECKNDYHEFLCQLKAVLVHSPREFTEYTNINFGNERYRQCLLKLLEKNLKNKCNKIEREQGKSFEKKSQCGIAELINMCLQLNLTSHEIMSLVKTINKHSNKKPTINVDNLKPLMNLKPNEIQSHKGNIKLDEKSDMKSSFHYSTIRNINRVSNSHNTYTKYFTLTQSPYSNTPYSYSDETDISQPVSLENCPETSEYLKPKHTKSDSKNNIEDLNNSIISKNIFDIKTTLEEIKHLLGSESNCFEEFSKEPSNKIQYRNYKESKLNNDVIELYTILQNWFLNRNLKKKISTEENENDFKKKKIFLNCLPETIPVISKFQEDNIIPILDAYSGQVEDKSKNLYEIFFTSHDKSETSNHPTGDKTLPNEEIKNGTTNIYYVNSTSINDLKELLKSKEYLCKETEIIVEHQRIRKSSKPKSDNPEISHARIAVDFNSSPEKIIIEDPSGKKVVTNDRSIHESEAQNELNRQSLKSNEGSKNDAKVNLSVKQTSQNK